MARNGPPSTPALTPDPRVSGWALLPLRLFLGVTFCYAGLQKLADPGFFRASDPASIQAQLAAGARHSPIHGLLSALGHVAVPVGIVIAFAELAVGLGTLLGLYTRIAALGGMALSFGLFLAVSFHSHPYFTGSDIVFFFAWIPLLVAGPGGAPTLDEYLAGLVRARRNPGPAGRGARPRPGTAIDRRTFTAQTGAAAAVGGFALVLGGLAAAVGRALGGDKAGAGPQQLSAGAATTTTTGGDPASTSTTSDPATTQASHPPGTRLGPASDVPVGGAAGFTDPASGDPALVIQPTSGTFLAFDAVCPHAGCTVQYSSGDRAFICPCHGSQFNGRTGDVEVGPAQSGLRKIAIAKGSDGDLYAR